jgi:hypothetical protein
MKILVRSFALSLVLAGLVANYHTQTKEGGRFIQGGVISNNMPIPVCPPNDPNACGIDK